jgi:group I intron endonuclease
MYFTIYKISNQLDGKFYIGKHQTKKLDDDYFGSGKLLGRAIKKHGKENFLKEILHVFDNEEEMNAKEAELVDIDSKMSYNLCEGGKGGFGYINSKGLQHTEKQKAAALKTLDKYRNKDGYLNLKRGGNGHLKTFLGKKHSDETKAKISKSHNPASHPRGPRGPYKKKLESLSC